MVQRNTVFIALSLLSLGRVPLRPALVSLIGFLGFGLIMGQTGIRIGKCAAPWEQLDKGIVSRRPTCRGTQVRRLPNSVGARTIGWLLFSLLVQTSSLLLATILVSPIGPASFYAGGPNQWVLVLLTAISGGTQIAMVRKPFVFLILIHSSHTLAAIGFHRGRQVSESELIESGQ
jgi:hypothetical protein